MPPRTESWSNLPPELLVTIADQYASHLGVLRLRSICRSWRNAISRDRLSDASVWSLRIPFPILTPKAFFRLSKSTVCYVESSVLRKIWLVKIEEFQEGKLLAFDPVSLNRMLGFPKDLNLVDLRVFEIARSLSFRLRLDVRKLRGKKIIEESLMKKKIISFIKFSLKIFFPLNFPISKRGLSIFKRRKGVLNMKKISKKVVVSSVDGYVRSDDLVMVIFDGGSLSHVRIGDEKWGEVKEWQLMKLYSDVIFRNERFYAVDGGGGLLIVDRSLDVEIFPWLGPSQDSCEKKYLIEAGGRLFLVIKKILFATADCVEESIVARVSEEDEDSHVWFEVFCFKEKEKDWIQVYSLGELAFFVADDCSFSVVACDSPPYQRNCIYYADYDVADSKAPSCSVYNLENKLSSERSGY